MRRGMILFLAILLVSGIPSVFAAVDSPDAEPVIPQNLRSNQYFTESLRLSNLARLSFDSGDYDASTNYAEEALRYARLSDEYVALQLKIREVNEAIGAAKTRLDWAASVGASNRYPREYGEAENYYNTSRSLRSAEDWDRAIEAAGKVMVVLAHVEETGGIAPLPAQYTVRPWNISGDCFWNIAGKPWAYGDPSQWRILYNANKAKLPDPNNPNLIKPGMVLDIPSIGGEIRQGMWTAGQTYSPLR
ncbi:hypothetical protein AGMMS49587_12860 [Spirochaetia bacterium]|nr:hypothetical protein AGMMS49587_12860 [Spirochaetia bacterium]